MSRLSFTEALDQALELLEQGHPLEYCVRQFPEYTDELRPLLQVSDDLHRLADAPLPLFDRTAVEPDWESLLADVPQQQPGRFKRYSLALTELFRSLQYHPVQRYAALTAAVIILVVVSWRGSAESHPRSPLYQIKQLTEQVELGVALSPESEVERRIEFTRRRLEELQTLTSQTHEIDPELLRNALTQAQGAVEAAEQGGVGEEYYDQLVLLLADTQASISQLKDELPAPQVAVLDNADLEVAELREDLNQILIAESGVTPTVTPTAAPVSPTPTIPSPTKAPTTSVPTDLPTLETDPVADSPSVASPAVITATPSANVPTRSTPTPLPTVVPTTLPTPRPTVIPTAVPTSVPTAVPTEQPTALPTEAPTLVPTEAPTEQPTEAPTEQPTAVPTEAPTLVPTEEPTAEPTAVPTEQPTEQPTAVPTEAPTLVPTEEPTAEPTAVPTEQPTAEPTDGPIEGPTEEPTEQPTSVPTEQPTAEPTELPTDTIVPLPSETAAPIETASPSPEPTQQTVIPTIQVTITIVVPTEQPTNQPTEQPTETSTIGPTDTTGPLPTEEPTATEEPTTSATEEPTTVPTEQPTEQPTETSTSSTSLVVAEVVSVEPATQQTISLPPMQTGDQALAASSEQTPVIADKKLDAPDGTGIIEVIARQEEAVTLPEPSQQELQPATTLLVSEAASTTVQWNIVNSP